MVELQDLKSLKKELKLFQKLSKKDNEKASDKAKDILKKIIQLKKDPVIKNNESNIHELNKTKDMLNLYIKNIEEINKINEKWNIKK
ncbi:MAG: hypothetical protein ACTSRG_23965 [Candidatus Helarchaeota archaeon]